MKNADMPIVFVDGNDAASIEQCRPARGLTKREYFAGLAMQGILANETYDPPRRKRLGGMAADAVAAADALLSELEASHDNQ